MARSGLVDTLTGSRGTAQVEPETVPGPWVLVVGMHRSGTSAVAGLLASLGLHEPAGDDLMANEPDNPNHHESWAMSNVGEAVLEALGGSWALPPLLVPGWANEDAVTALLPHAFQAATSSYPAPGPRVFKDPRTALLLPFWRQLLESPLPTLFIWRSPAAVARSLERRDKSLQRDDKISFTHGVALWHHYNHAALNSLTGRDVLVVPYEELVLEPERIALETARWLDRLDVPPPRDGWRIAEAARSVLQELEHEGGYHEDLHLEAGLGDLLRELRGSHQPLTPGMLPAMPAWVSDTLDDRRSLAADRRSLATEHEARLQVEAALAHVAGECAALTKRCERSDMEADALREQLAVTQGQLAAVYRSTSWRVSAPLRVASDLAHRSQRGRGPRQPAEPSTTGGLTVWITGLPAAGKTTTGRSLVDHLRSRGMDAKLIDGDELRATVSADLGFSASDRAENVRRAGERAQELAQDGGVAVVTMVSPFADGRAEVRERHRSAGVDFVEIWLSTPVEVCEARDPKGLYARARRGLVADMTGVDQPYEPPAEPELTCDTSQLTVEQATEQIAEAVSARLRLPARN